MSRITLDSTLAMIAYLDGARSLDELRNRLLQLTEAFGVEHILAGVLPSRNATTSEQLEGILLADWPAEWSNRYFSKGYVYIDPTIEAIRNSTKCFTWNEISSRLEKGANSKLVMNEATEFNLLEGLTVPLMTAEGKAGGFSLAGRHLELTECTSGIISLLANYAFAKAIALRGVVSVAPAMTRRQMDVIRWAAEGKTDWEIGMILNISEHTVDKYMREVKEKLVATNRVQVIARAIRLGLIS